ncbi:hypothetical protein LCGC14_2711180, partial [marine sediment metagenome]
MTNKAFLVRDGLRSGSTLVINSAGGWVGNTITEVFGGTAQTTYAIGDILFASAPNTLSKLPKGSAGQVLTMGSPLLPSWAANAGLQNLFDEFTGDTGSIVADDTNQKLIIAGGTGISTVIAGSPVTLTITNDSPNVDQNIWLNIDADSGGPVAADTTSDTFTITGGTLITTSISGDAVTINWAASLNDLSDVTITGGAGSPSLPTIGDTLFYDGAAWVNLARGTAGQVLTMGSPLVPSWAANTGVQNLFDEFVGDTGSIVADDTNQKLIIAGGAGISTAIAGSPVTLTITNDSPNVDQNIFATVTGDSGTVTADSTATNVKIAGGLNITTSATGSPQVLTVATLADIVVDSVDLGVIGTFTSSTLTTAATTQVAIGSFAIATYRSAEFTIQAVQGDNYHTTK